MSGKEKLSCEICGKPGGLFVVFGKKDKKLYKYGRDNVIFWICKHCEKAIRWTLARMEDARKEDGGL